MQSPRRTSHLEAEIKGIARTSLKKETIVGIIFSLFKDVSCDEVETFILMIENVHGPDALCCN